MQFNLALALMVSFVLCMLTSGVHAHQSLLLLRILRSRLLRQWRKVGTIWDYFKSLLGLLVEV